MKNVEQWSHGGGPDQFGWAFRDAQCRNIETLVTAEQVDECQNRGDAESIGIPDDVLDAFEAAYNATDVYCQGYGSSLCDYLQSLPR